MNPNGYNACHLAEFSREELHRLANVLPQGLTYRIYGGFESLYFDLTDRLCEFLAEVRGNVIVTMMKGMETKVENDIRFMQTYGIAIKGIEYDNERWGYEPNIFTDSWGAVWRFVFNKRGYYTDLAWRHITDLNNELNNPNSPLHDFDLYYSLPLKVNQNVGYKAYADIFLRYGPEFVIDSHIFGDDPAQTRANLQWLKDHSEGRDMAVLEFNERPTDRTQASALTNSDLSVTRFRALLNVIEPFTDEVLYFTLAANPVTQNWRNPSYLHKYFVTSQSVTNEIQRVWS